MAEGVHAEAGGMRFPDTHPNHQQLYKHIQFINYRLLQYERESKWITIL